MLTEQFDAALVKKYLTIIHERASPRNPLHRAKALKLSKLPREMNIKLLSAKDKEEFWSLVKIDGWVELDSMGYITGLSEKSRSYLGCCI